MIVLTIGSYFRIAAVSILFISFSSPIVAHGLVTIPRQRGALRVQNRLVGDIDPGAPFDSAAHYPAGDKNRVPGSGKRSVMRAASNIWTPYEPLHAGFQWRAGVCGDDRFGNQEHLKGGKYYYPASDPIRVNTYHQGDTVDFEVNVVSHHNGYFEFYICNIDRCGEDISVDCFRSGYCEQLMRAASFCDSGDNEDCGPIDSSHKGRWYLPCGLFPKGQSLYGGVKNGSMKFQLPKDLHCDHCVIQWYWTAANTCNPPGVVDYFEGPNGPRWPLCRGQGGAIGGYTKMQRECGGDNFPEEYWQCSDVRILRNSESADINNPRGVDGNGKGQDLQFFGGNSNENAALFAGTEIGASSVSGSSSGFVSLGKEGKKGSNNSWEKNKFKITGDKRRNSDGSEDVTVSQTHDEGEGVKDGQQTLSGLPVGPDANPTVTPTPILEAQPQGANGILNGAFDNGILFIKNEASASPALVISPASKIRLSTQIAEVSGHIGDGAHEQRLTEGQFRGTDLPQKDGSTTQLNRNGSLLATAPSR